MVAYYVRAAVGRAVGPRVAAGDDVVLPFMLGVGGEWCAAKHRSQAKCSR